jgi:hypothetical protein
MSSGQLAFLYCTLCQVYAPSGHPRIEEWLGFHTGGGCGRHFFRLGAEHIMMSDEIVEGYRMENGLSPLDLLAFAGTPGENDGMS